MRWSVSRLTVPILLLSLFAGGCGSASPEEPAESAPSLTLADVEREDESVPTASYAFKAEEKEEEQVDFVPYQAPEFADSAFHEEHAQVESKGKVKLDLEHTSEGYLGVSVESDRRIKLQVFINETEYRYEVRADGTPMIFPFSEGDGVYTIKVMENVETTKYRPLCTVDCDVELEDEFQPFLRPSSYVDYDEDSDCVLLAAELASKEEDELGVVGAVFDYICDHIVYDKEKAAEVQKTTGYLPVLDDTLESGKGICFDYASLVAAMLRSQGIPTKMVFGDVSPNDIYHAWNMFYTEETGWVTVKYEVKAGSWNRLDLTYSANGADSSFIGDGGNYLDETYY